MSNTDYSDFSTPFTKKTYSKLIGKLNQQNNVQLAPATLAGAVMWVATFAGVIGDVYIALDALPGAGESMVIDVKKNGVSLLSAPKTLDNTITDKMTNIRALLNPALNSFVTGDLITVDRTYVAGATPTPMVTNAVSLEPSVSPYYY
jgi:hypothetical protein